MSPYTAVCRTMLFPLHERLKRHNTVSMRRQLEHSQWLNTGQISALQLRNLRAFLQYAGSAVPYYRKVFAETGFDAASLTDVSQLRALPMLDKTLIRTHATQLCAEGAGDLQRFNTGGSTGEPLVFYMSRDRITHDVAAKWRATRWWNVDIGDPEVVLWGSPIELGKQDRIKILRDRLFRSHLLPAFDMSPAQMSLYLERIHKWRPRMLFGYASALALLAEHARQESRDMRHLGIRVAFTTGETLYPAQRDVIESVFGCPVANGYGARDAGFIAHQCPAGSLHVSAEHIVVELVDSNGDPVPNGEPGEIVVTHTATRGFPFIRYRTGDIASMATEPCSCKRGLPVFASVQGRSTDFIRTRSGKLMHALALIYEVRDKPGVRAFKFIQAQDLSLELLLVVGEGFTPAIAEAIRTGVSRRMGDGPGPVIRPVEAIAPEKSGKYRYVVSHATGMR